MSNLIKWKDDQGNHHIIQKHEYEGHAGFICKKFVNGKEEIRPYETQETRKSVLELLIDMRGQVRKLVNGNSHDIHDKLLDLCDSYELKETSLVAP